MNSYLYRIIRKIRIFPQKSFVKLHYKYQTGKVLHLKNPIDFNEKIQWLKIYYKPPILTQVVDKYEVRSFVSERVGSQYLNEIYGVYESIDAIDFNTLPARFVLKATHGYDMNLIVEDKRKLNFSKVQCMASKWLHSNHYHDGKEWAYKNIKPRLIVEKFLKENNKEDINDYKFYCFNGTPKFLKVDMNRYQNHSTCYYDLQWNILPFSKDDNFAIAEAGSKPKHFEEMIEVSTKLSRGFPFVRVDLYNIEGQIIFGEMTFYPADGRLAFKPEQYNQIIGGYINLPEMPRGQKKITSF